MSRTPRAKQPQRTGEQIEATILTRGIKAWERGFEAATMELSLLRGGAREQTLLLEELGEEVLTELIEHIRVTAFDYDTLDRVGEVRFNELAKKIYTPYVEAKLEYLINEVL